MKEIRVLGPDDIAVLDRVADGVFDGPIVPELAAEVLADARHHLVVAIDDGIVVGMASALHYVHPDKSPELWINEVGVADTHVRQGVATQLLRALFAVGRRVGCTEGWVLTDRPNAAANRLYGSLGGELDTDVVMYSFQLGDYGS